MRTLLLTTLLLSISLSLSAQNCDSIFVESFLSLYKERKDDFDKKVKKHIPREYRNCDILYKFDIETKYLDNKQIKPENLFCCFNFPKNGSWMAFLHQDGIVRAELNYSSAMRNYNFYDHLWFTNFETVIKSVPNAMFWYISWPGTYFFIKDHQLMVLIDSDEQEIKTAKEFLDTDFKKYYYDLDMGLRIPRDTVEARKHDNKKIN